MLIVFALVPLKLMLQFFLRMSQWHLQRVKNRQIRTVLNKSKMTQMTNFGSLTWTAEVTNGRLLKRLEGLKQQSQTAALTNSISLQQIITRPSSPQERLICRSHGLPFRDCISRCKSSSPTPFYPLTHWWRAREGGRGKRWWHYLLRSNTHANRSRGREIAGPCCISLIQQRLCCPNSFICF